mmetsp:Transcript_67118/g.120868  ORF Transcript_67118/g.120868 Transcript_67118/m.120868 type:complete len:85 (-) Transcript_67118:828-1082(-)
MARARGVRKLPESSDSRDRDRRLTSACSWAVKEVELEPEPEPCEVRRCAAPLWKGRGIFGGRLLSRLPLLRLLRAFGETQAELD